MKNIFIVEDDLLSFEYLKVMPVPIAINDDKQNIIYINSAFIKTFGYTLDDIPVLSEWWLKAYPDPAYKQWIAEEWTKRLNDSILNNTTFEPIDVKIVCKNGEHRFAIVQAAPIEGSMLGCHLVILQDITDRKKVEIENELNKKRLEALLSLAQTNSDALAESNRTKDKLFSIIGHDLKSPFNSILGFSELLIENLREYDTDKIERFLHNIHNQAKQTFDLLENLLNWSKSQRGQLLFSPERINLTDFIADAIDNMKTSARLKNIALNFFMVDEVIVKADINMLNTILRNLISNAIKFTKSGGKINVYAIKDRNTIEITVSDNGIGMSEVDKANLFRLAGQTSKTGTANEKGTGLGLMLCKEFVEKHNGKICVESKEEKGSDFKFTLPL